MAIMTWPWYVELVVCVALVLLILRVAEPIVTSSMFLTLFLPVCAAIFLGVAGFAFACWVPLFMLALGFILPARTAPKTGFLMCGSCHKEWRSPNNSTGYTQCASCAATTRSRSWEQEELNRRDD
jgi:ABC-type transport system involved in cytochrome bd biosynthesis fused ATPase/permease subunit